MKPTAPWPLSVKCSSLAGAGDSYPRMRQIQHGEIDKFREQKRDRWVTAEELTRLAVAISQDRNLYARPALWLYLLTGVRKTELLRVRWEDIDFSRAELRLPDTKPGRTHHVPLSAPALALLDRLPRQEGNAYILPGLKPGQHLVNIEKPWRRVRKAAGIEDVRLHDLRRTVGSWLAQAGHSLPLIGRVLNHTNPATTAIYARLGDDPAREALEDHARRLAEVSGAAFLAGTAHTTKLPPPFDSLPHNLSET